MLSVEDKHQASVKSGQEKIKAFVVWNIIILFYEKHSDACFKARLKKYNRFVSIRRDPLVVCFHIVAIITLIFIFPSETHIVYSVNLTRKLCTLHILPTHFKLQIKTARGKITSLKRTIHLVRL